MSRTRLVCAACALVTCLVASVPALAGASEPGPGGIGALTFETSAGPVTCAVDPAQQIGPEDITTISHHTREVVTLLATGALVCETSLGEVEISGAGLPWRLVLHSAKHTVTLRGAPRLELQAQLVALPSVHCLYQAGGVKATVSSEQPLAIAVSVPRVKLNPLTSNPLCPALGPLSLAVTIP